MENIQLHDGSGDKEYFTMVPNYVLNHSTIWDREVYIQMKKIAGENGTCFMAIKKLMKQCGVSKERLSKSIKYLVEHKWISFVGQKEIPTRGGNQYVNEYRINNIWKMNSDYYSAKGGSPNDTPIAKGGSPNCAKGGRQISKGGSPDDHYKDPSEEEPIEEDRENLKISGNKLGKTKLDELRAKIKSGTVIKTWSNPAC